MLNKAVADPNCCYPTLFYEKVCLYRCKRELARRIPKGFKILLDERLYAARTLFFPSCNPLLHIAARTNYNVVKENTNNVVCGADSLSAPPLCRMVVLCLQDETGGVLPEYTA